MMRRAAVLALSVVCLGACSSSGSNEREVLVDYSPDDVSVFVANDFPAVISVKPGQTIAFKQTWTGEPHTVTGGSNTNAAIRQANKWSELFNSYIALAEHNDMVDPSGPTGVKFAEFAAKIKAAKPTRDAEHVFATWRSLRDEYPRLPDMDHPPDIPFDDVNNLIDELSANDPSILEATEDQSTVNQNVAQPCYLRAGAPPEDTTQSCTAAQQRQPAFDGTQSFYNSGVLPYEGPRGNTFRMPIAKTTKPGTYYFYCAVHGAGQQVAVRVVKPGQKVPSASAVARQGRKEAEDLVAQFKRTFRDASKNRAIEVRGHKLREPFAGLPSEIHGGINEFLPRTINAKAGQPITWNVIGNHTISFDVPAYIPILEFTPNNIRFNPKVHDIAGGAPLVPPQEEGEAQKFDAGTYSGSGFWSSGLMGADPYLEYTLRITKPGTYPYACLVHPKMIGKIVVT